MADPNSFREKQYAFAAHIRDPDNVEAPAGIESRRMAIYRKLFFNNLFSLLGTFFPVLRKIHSNEQWRGFVRGFMQHHQAQTPYFLQLPEEFLGYLQSEFEPADDDYPFLLELAHYEYAELALSISEDENDLSGIDPDGDLLTGIPVKSVLSWPYAYQYAVHRISPDYLPREPENQPVYLALYRGDDGKVGFLELNAVSAALLDVIERNSENRSGEELLRALATTINYPDAEALVAHGADALQQMRLLGILTGTRNPASRSF
jgi:hypothetical protein